MYAATHIAGLWAGILWGQWIFLFRLVLFTHRLTGKDVKSPVSPSSMLGGAVEICSLIATPFLKYLWLMRLDWSWRKQEFGVGQYVEPWGNTWVQITGPMTVYHKWVEFPAGQGPGWAVLIGAASQLSLHQMLRECTSQIAPEEQGWGSGLWVLATAVQYHRACIRQTACVYHHIRPSVTKLLATQCSEFTETLIND